MMKLTREQNENESNMNEIQITFINKHTQA